MWYAQDDENWKFFGYVKFLNNFHIMGAFKFNPFFVLSTILTKRFAILTYSLVDCVLQENDWGIKIVNGSIGPIQQFWGIFILISR
jgi:hypothetical protein